MPAPLKLSLVSHARTTLRPSRFPDDEPLAAKALDQDLEWVVRAIGKPTRVVAGPGACTIRTAELMYGAAEIEPALADIDRGRWRGRDLKDIEAQEPGALVKWLADPDAAPYGGESRTVVVARVSSWLDAQIGGAGHVVAISYPDVLRAAMAAVLGAPPSALNSIDIEHLTVLEFRSDGRRWALRSLGTRNR